MHHGLFTGVCLYSIQNWLLSISSFITTGPTVYSHLKCIPFTMEISSLNPVCFLSYCSMSPSARSTYICISTTSNTSVLWAYCIHAGESFSFHTELSLHMMYRYCIGLGIKWFQGFHDFWSSFRNCRWKGYTSCASCSLSILSSFCFCYMTSTLTQCAGII